MILLSLHLGQGVVLSRKLELKAVDLCLRNWTGHAGFCCG